eukprot:TRINITY_DN387_c0_g1_i3.p1 TRINITY_DN387_c0_g1~~TRINITY_DN387_c0_g1_i3.p1  ORF type:complete len:527 (+),score=169.29 TRINITY_DN387_c0_g1_i3:46-1626(+)
MSGSTKCIMRQLKQLQRQPVAGAAAAPCNDNLNEIHCNVVGQTGAYKGVCVHFVLEISSDYPVSAPNAYFVTPIEYRGVAVMTDNKGRRAVCLNIFGNYKSQHSEWGSTNEGWSPGCTLETVLVQMQSLLSNEDNLLSADARSAIDHARSATCPCGHTAATPHPAVSEEVTPCTIAQHENIVCYSSGARLDEDSILGIGVNVTCDGFDTPGEILSHEAFARGVRKSSDNLRTFAYFLPISHTDEHHERVRNSKLFEQCLEKIAKAQSEMGKRYPESWVMQLVECASALMTALVVEVAKRPDGTTSDRFIECYYSVLDTLFRVDRDEGGVVSAHVDGLLKDFVKGEEYQVKSKVPNLGSLLALLPLSSSSWGDIANPLLEEMEARCVFWVVQGSFAQKAPHPELISPTATGRASKMFGATNVGRDLLCFQSLFESLAKGVLSKSMTIEQAKGAIKEGFAKVKKIASWEDYYTFLGVPPCKDQDARLLGAMQRSERCGYHQQGKGKGKGKGKGSKGSKGSKGGYKGSR